MEEKVSLSVSALQRAGRVRYEEPVHPPEAMVIPRPGLLTWATSGSMALPQPRCVLMSEAHVASQGHPDISGLGSARGYVDVWGLC